MVARDAVPDDAALTDLLRERTPLQQLGLAGQAARRPNSRVSGDEAS